MNEFIVVGYFTRNTFYEDYAQMLVKSLKQYSIPYYIEGTENLGSWLKNTNYKPTFIKEMLIKFPKHNIVYVDCDAKFLRYPKLFEEIEKDIAVHLFKGIEILSGTIFLKNKISSYELVKRWEELCRKKPHQWDQKSLAEVLGKNFYKLPVAYCQILNKKKRIKDRQLASSIIVHYQASRKVRNNRGVMLKSALRESLPQVLSKIVCASKH